MNPDQSAASPEGVTAGSVEQGARAGMAEGQSQLVELCNRAAPRGGRPGAAAVLDESSAKVVVFEFGAGDVLADHAARHPVLIQVIRGGVQLGLPTGSVELRPGQMLHLSPMLRHHVRALEATTLVVTMLLPHS